MLSKSASQFVVQIYKHWVNSQVIYYQLELCQNNLNEIIEQMPQFVKKFQSTDTDLLKYFICNEIFKDILNCVNYLHQLQPPIIHRDIKPLNILVSFDAKIKLGDFGEAIPHESDSISHTVGRGTHKYMAPEVKMPKRTRNKYSTKVDMYSLGFVLLDVFDIDLNE